MSEPPKQPGPARDTALIGAARRAAATNPASAPEVTATVSGGSAERPTGPDHRFSGYERLERLTQGGQGVVYRAVQARTARPVAIKVLRAGVFASEDALRRFDREIEIIGMLRHPNIVAVLHAGQTIDGEPFYVMEYVDGLPLTTACRRHHRELRGMLALFARLCAAVQHAHQHGVIHRDLKPANVLVDASGQPQVLDFGLGRLLESDATELTHSDEVMGTLRYMSPEQARGGARGVDTRTDVYSLGIMLYELLAGRHPVSTGTGVLEVLQRIIEDEARPLRQAWAPEHGACGRRGADHCPIDDDVETIVMRAIHKVPDRRYQSAGELGRDIERYLQGEPIDAKRDSFWYVLSRMARKNILQAVAAMSVALILVSSVSIVGYTATEKLAAERERDVSKSQQLRDLRQWGEYALPAAHRAMLLNVLLLYEDGRFGAAKRLAAAILPETSLEAQAARLLLAPDTCEADLRPALQAEPYLGDLILAARALRAGASSEALAHARAGLYRQPPTWWRWVLETYASEPGETP